MFHGYVFGFACSLMVLITAPPALAQSGNCPSGASGCDAHLRQAQGGEDRGSTQGGGGFMQLLKPITDPKKAEAIRKSLGVTAHPAVAERTWRQAPQPIITPACHALENRWGGASNDLNEFTATANGRGITARYIRRNYADRAVLYDVTGSVGVSGLKSEISLGSNAADLAPSGMVASVEATLRSTEWNGGPGGNFNFTVSAKGFQLKPAARNLAVNQQQMQDGEQFALLIPKTASGELSLTIALQGRPCAVTWVWKPAAEAAPSGVTVEQPPEPAPTPVETVGFCLKKFQGLDLYSADKPKCNGLYDPILKQEDVCSAACTYRAPNVATPVYAATVKWRRRPEWLVPVINVLSDQSEFFRPLPRELLKGACMASPAGGNTITSTNREAFAFFGGSGAREKASVLARRLLHEAEKRATACPRPGDKAPIPIGEYLEEARKRGVAAHITGLLGDVRVIRLDGTSVRATKGMEIYQGERVVTGKDGRARLERTDASSHNGITVVGQTVYLPYGSIINVAPSSDIEVYSHEACYDDTGVSIIPVEGASHRHPKDTYELIRGWIRVHFRGWGPDAMIDVRAGTAVCGIRGTEFTLGYDPGSRQVDLLLHHGKIAFSTPTADRMVEAGEQITVTGDKMGEPTPLSQDTWEKQVSEISRGLPDVALNAAGDRNEQAHKAQNAAGQTPNAQAMHSGGWLGVMVQDIAPDTARSLGLARPEGAYVAEVPAGSPAIKELKRGDAILDVNGETVKNAAGLAALIRRYPPGTSVSLEVLRKGAPILAHVELGDRAPASP